LQGILAAWFLLLLMENSGVARYSVHAVSLTEVEGGAAYCSHLVGKAATHGG